MLNILIKDTDIAGTLNEILVEGVPDIESSKADTLDSLYKKAKKAWLDILEKDDKDYEEC